MQAKFICHRDFSERIPKNVFGRERATKPQNDGPEFLNRHILFRKTAEFQTFSKAVLRITADDYFKLYINGEFAVQGPPPGYPHRYYYMEIDVTRFLKRGKNAFAVHTYYQGLCNRVWVSADGRACFWCELYLDGVLSMVSDESWRVREHGGYSACGVSGYDTQFCERYDSNAAEADFYKADFDDRGWEYAGVFRHADYALIRSPLRPLEITFRAPVETRRDEGRLFLDFGQEAVGTLRIEARGKRGEEVEIRCGEELNADGSVRERLRCGCEYRDFWMLSGGHDVFDAFDYKGFRYAEILFPRGVRILKAEMRVRRYPYERKCEFCTENRRLNEILSLCENTVRYGVQETFLDCPTREKGQYLGDLCVSGRAYAALTRDTVPLKKALQDFCASALFCEGLTAVAPASRMQEIADYSLLFPALLLWTYKTDGDAEFLKRTAECVVAIERYFKRYADADGLLSGVNEKWNLVDWPENCRDGYDFRLDNPIGDGAHNVLNALWIGFLQAADEIYRIAGREPIEGICRLKESFIRRFYNPETGLFCDSAEKKHASYHSNVLPLLFSVGTEDEARRRKTVDFICKKGLRAGSVYFAYFALAALVRCGERERAEALATADDAWAGMLREGATTTFEAWNKEGKWNTSLFHPWAVAPVVVFAEDTEPY